MNSNNFTADPGGSEPEAGEILDSETEVDQKRQNKEEESQSVVDQEEAKKLLNLPEVKVCSAAEAQKQESLTPADLKAYCQKLFEFKELRTLHFKFVSFVLLIQSLKMQNCPFLKGQIRGKRDCCFIIEIQRMLTKF